MGKSEMISKGKKKYKAGIERIGVSTYHTCGEKGGMDVAVCLKEAKKKLTSSDWASAWKSAMEA